MTNIFFFFRPKNSNLEIFTGIVRITLTVSGSAKERPWSPKYLLDARTISGYCFYIWSWIVIRKVTKLWKTALQSPPRCLAPDCVPIFYTHRTTIKIVSILNIMHYNIQDTSALWKKYILYLSTCYHQEILNIKVRLCLRVIYDLCLLNSALSYITSENKTFVSWKNVWSIFYWESKLYIYYTSKAVKDTKTLKSPWRSKNLQKYNFKGNLWKYQVVCKITTNTMSSVWKEYLTFAIQE